MNRIATSRSQANRLCRLRAVRPCLEMLEARSQPGSLFGGEMGLDIATPALDLDLPKNNRTDSAIVRRRTMESAVDTLPSATSAMEVEIVSSVTNPARQAPMSSITANSTLAMPAPPTMARSMTMPATSVAQTVDADTTVSGAPSRQQVAASPTSLPSPIQTAVQPTTPIANQLEVTQNYDSKAWTVTAESGELRADMDWASFSGSIVQSNFANVTVSNDQQFVYVVGSQGNPNQTVELLVGKIAANGTSASFLTLSMSNLTIGNDIAVDYKGVAYVVGATRLNGTTDPMVVRINADFTAFDWVATIPNPTSGDAANGIVLTPNGKSLYISGVLNSSWKGGHTDDVLVGKYSDLSNPAGPHQDALALLIFEHPSFGTDIARSWWGDLTLSGAYIIPGTRAPALFRVDGALSNQQLAYYPLPGTSNDFNSISVDWLGNAYATGRAALSNSSVVDLLLVKFERDFSGEHWSYQYDNPVDPTKEFLGSGIAVDLLGHPYVSGRDTGDVLVAKFERNGASIRDSLKVGGSATDSGAGIARTFLTGKVYVAGSTSSANFPVTEGVFAPTYNGTARDGLTMQVSHFS